MHWLDTAWLRLTQRVSLFARGWGAHEDVMTAARPLLAPHDALPVSLTWNGPLGTAPSPCSLLKTPLTVHRLTPKKIRARVVLPPSWGDEGFSQRRFGFGALAREGVELWMLEGAFFGSRRNGAKLALATVEEFLMLGLANVLEVRALVATARLDNLPVAVAGYSMAGQICAQAVASLPWEIPVVAMAPSDSAAPVFIDGPLSKAVDFAALGADGREKLHALFHRARIQVLPPPRSNNRIVVGTRHDGIVPPSAMERVAQHWNVTPRWLDTGHLGAYVFHRKVLQHAVLEALGL